VAVRATGRGADNAGRRRAQPTPGRGLLLRPALLLVVGTIAAGAAWVFLVVSAIQLGRAAREDASASGWAFTVAATVGAALCLLLAFVLLLRLRAVFAGRAHHQRGRHR
jgi:TRAP-type C4-dicarboxylate transport system permease small subunit